MTLQRAQFQKANTDGGQVNPGHPDDYQPHLQTLDDATWLEDTQEAIRVVNEVNAGEWPTRFFEKWGAQASIPDPLYPMVQARMAEKGLTEAQACADLVRMDEPFELANEIAKWCRRVGIKPAAEYRRCEEPDIDFITEVIQPIEFMLTGLSAAMDVCFHEKSFHSECRPEEVVEEATGVAPCVFTAYVDGCPLHPERPAGHGMFSGYIGERATMFYESGGEVFRQVALHVALWRVLAGMHTGRSCVEGVNMSKPLALAA